MVTWFFSWSEDERYNLLRWGMLRGECGVNQEVGDVS